MRCACVLVLLFSTILSVSWSAEDRTFPPGFKFGVASAAYQVEGAWNVSDKSPSIWDTFTHTYPEAIKNNDNGDVACDSYHLWETDVNCCHELGVDFYRISISWSRLLPTGFANHISEDGARYYNTLIDGLLAKNVEPMITLYHWDLPQTLQDLGGWTNPLISDWFANYARVVYSLYGDRVKMWLTINEGMVVCDGAYNTGIIAPGIFSPDPGAYLCNKHVLLAHAKAYRIYDKEFKHKYHGEVSIANHLMWFEPYSENDMDLTELARENCAGRYSHPIYSKKGGWPPAIEKLMAENSRKKGYPESTFPAFTKEEIKLIQGTYDYYAFNYYTTRLVRRATEDEVLAPWPAGDMSDLNAALEMSPDWPVPAPYFAVWPEGIRRQLQWLKKHYGDLKFVITENGFPDTGGINDEGRINFYQQHLEQLLLAIHEDDINLTHFTAWTLLDNFEWTDGYATKFGLYEVDFNDPQRTRTPRDSARWYTDFIKNNTAF